MATETTALARDLRALVDGQLSDAPETLAAYATDYGQVVRRQPAVVVRPHHTRDVVQVVRYAYQQHVPVSSRGVGHSVGGQSLNDAGIVLDMRCINHHLEIQPTTLEFSADAGVLWRDIVSATTAYGLVPPVLTGYPHVSIAGTHAAVGWGTSSARYGAQIDNCLAVEIVTGTGELLTCTPEENGELFSHTLGGMGQFGIMTRIRHRLRSYRPVTRTYTLMYADLGTFLEDNRLLVSRGAGDYLDCTISPRVYETHREWDHVIRLSVEVEPGRSADEAIGIESLRFDRQISSEEMPTGQFVQQLKSVQKLPQTGVAHPWVVTFLPWTRTQSYIEMCLSQLPFGVLGGRNGPLHLWTAQRSITRMPMLRVPEEDVITMVGIFPTVRVEQMRQALTFLHLASDLGLKLGGKRHLATWVHFDEARWQLHFGDYWPVVAALKRKYDPAGILNPGLLASAKPLGSAEVGVSAPWP